MSENSFEPRNAQSNDGVRLFGRRKIFTSVENITQENVIAEVTKAIAVHFENLFDEEYLYWYRRGVQPILNRVKEVRPEICNKVVVNNADMVVTFKDGYFLTKPVNYISRVEDEKITEEVKELNEYLHASGKHHADNEVVDAFHTMGVGCLFVEPNASRKRKPVNVYALDPRSAFVVYSLKPGSKPVMGIHIVVSDKKMLIDVFTDNYVFYLSGGYGVSDIGGREKFSINGTPTTIERVERNAIGLIPIIEYVANKNRMASFEVAIPIMNAINLIESSRADGVEQAIQQLCVAYNCNFEEGVTANSIRQAGMIALKSIGDNKADFKILESNLNQADTQTAIDSLYEQMLEKCGVPSSVRDGGSTSDNVGAVYLRSGWATADTNARNTEDYFRESNERFTEVFLRILQMKGLCLSVEPQDIDIVFIRNQLDNLMAKTQSALNMKWLGLAPEIVLERSGLSNDPIADVERSQKYIEIMWSNDSLSKTTVANREKEDGYAT